MNVRDIMQTDVVTAHPDQSVRELTRLLAEHGISGVPVVTDSGEVLGVVSSSDVVRVAAEADSVPVTGARWIPVPPLESTVDPEDPVPDPYSDYFLPEAAPVVAPEWDLGESDGALDQLSVSDIMTPVSFTVEGSATLAELADFLVRGKIHRALVLDEGRLTGIVTAMDVLRVVAEG
ncbi:MAG TPA: CBS domain-containing protein [Longimicrobiales bacterium]|nr:CBS domain-containing protein [Longimicrobiales bacterium]